MSAEAHALVFGDPAAAQRIVAMRALDLFCKAGGATRGLQMAGYHVTGVDIAPQPRYVGEVFHQDDAMAWLRGEREPLASFDLVWASPPCQHYSELTPAEYKAAHPNLLPEVFDILRAHPVPYIVENVAGARAHFRNPIVLCGSMFGLRFWRHRWFEVGNVPGLFFLLPPCNHSEAPVMISGQGNRRGPDGRRPGRVPADVQRAAMEVPWMTRDEVTEAIPPAYSRFLAEQIQSARRAA